METVIGVTPIAVHIPDAPSKAEVMAVLEHLEYGVCFHQLDPAVAADGLPLYFDRPLPFPGGQVFNLVPVMSVRWIESVDPTVATVYIEDKAYTFPINWIEDHRNIQINEIKASA